MADRRPQLGDLFIAHFPQHRPPGREQEDIRPALVVGLPGLLGQPRYPMMLVAPVTADQGQPWARQSPDLYPSLPARTAGLRSDSLVLLDQVRSLDEDRIVGFLGTLSADRYASISLRLREMFGQP